MEEEVTQGCVIDINYTPMIPENQRNLMMIYADPTEVVVRHRNPDVLF